MVQVALKVLVGGNAGKEIPVPVERFLIGRSDECHLRPKSDAISRNHCTILVREDSVAVRDMNSRNGTYVNDERITGEHVLKSGDKLKVAKLEFEVLIKESKKPSPPKSEPAPEKAARAESDTKEKKAGESSSIEFDITEWLEEGNAKDKSTKRSDPDTRQFKLDETDRVALEQAAASSDSQAKKFTPPAKKSPGKLPERPKQSAANSREAAADMLKKFFNNR